MRFPWRGAGMCAVLCIGLAATLGVVFSTTVHAASSLDRTGRFAIQWWTIEDGLPEAPVNGLAFAPDGTLFCTSPTRISRFNGVTFEPLPSRVTDPVREAVGGFSNIGFDQDGRLWVQGGRAAAMLSTPDHHPNRWHWTVHVHRQGRFNSLAFTREGRPVLVGPNTVLMFDG